MQVEANAVDDVTTKVIAGLIILVCLALGLLGLILPIIPGLLFLAVAAIVAARYSPELDRWLRQNRTMSEYLDRTEGFADLSLAKKAQLGGLLCIKMLIDGLAFVISAATKLVNLAATKYRAN
jgi:uncharacterized membrane protein YbaN (DUF454 family)